MTFTVIYPQNAFRIRVVSNLSPPIRAVLGDFPPNMGIMGIKTSTCAGKSRFGESSWVKRLETSLLKVANLSL